MNSDEGRDAMLMVEERLPADQWRSVLYIGWHPKTFREWHGDWYLHHIREKANGLPVSHVVIEKHDKYAKELRDHPLSFEFGIRVICDDVVKWSASTKGQFDLVIWWHGPEHVEDQDVGPTLVNLWRLCGGVLLIGCPDGASEYEDPEANDYHRCAISDLRMRGIGYETKTVDRSHKKQGPALIAVRARQKRIA